jgi:RNA polymerase sporulation-specific sigma factor
MSAGSLYAQHRNLAEAISREWRIPGLDRDDLSQEAQIGLWVAARSWRRERNASFKNFARLVIKRRLATILKAALREKHRPLNEALRVWTTEDGEVAIIDVIEGGEDPLDVVITRERLQRITAAAATLTATEREALAHHLNGGAFYEDGVKNKRIDNGVIRARAKLRKAAA